ncbi:hypothetical protein CA984_44215, partial [Streptosporangium minutum]
QYARPRPEDYAQPQYADPATQISPPPDEPRQVAALGPNDVLVARGAVPPLDRSQDRAAAGYGPGDGYGSADVVPRENMIVGDSLPYGQPQPVEPLGAGPAEPLYQIPGDLYGAQQPDPYGVSAPQPDPYGVSPQAQQPDAYGVSPQAQQADPYGVSPQVQQPDPYGVSPQAQQADPYGVPAQQPVDPFAPPAARQQPVDPFTPHVEQFPASAHQSHADPYVAQGQQHSTDPFGFAAQQQQSAYGAQPDGYGYPAPAQPDPYAFGA